MAEAPEESIVPGLFPSVLLLCFAEPCVLADPTEVDEFDLHVFCSISVVRFVRIACVWFRSYFVLIHATRSFMQVYEHA